MDNCQFETYKDSVILHGRYIYATAYNMAMMTMCAYQPSQHAFQYWKCVLLCFANSLHIDIPD